MYDAAPDRGPRFVAAKVSLVLLVPLLGLLGLAGVAAEGYTRQATVAGELRTAVAAGVAADRAATALARERYAAAVFLQTGTAEDRAGLDAAAAATDPAVAALRAAAGPAGLAPPSLDGLAALRGRVSAGDEGVAAGEYLMAYTQMESDLVALRQSVAGRSGPGDVLAAARASGWLAVAREQLAQIQLLDLRGAGTPARREDLAAHRATHLDALRRFADTAPPALRDRLAQVPSGLGGDAQPALDALADLATAAGAAETALAASARDRQGRIVVAGLAVVLLLAVGSVTLAAVVARSLRRGGPGPRRRRKAAPPAATDPAGLTVTADRPLRPMAPTARGDGDEPAGLGAGSPAALAGLARKSQRLADALVQHLDAAERDEADPERLAQLFAFDHLATRIRHDNQSLLVLAGGYSATGRRDPVGLVDLLRAAQSRIEDYRRVEYAMIAPDVHVAPQAADDVVHLLAELFDNAARYGPPDRPVLVEGRRAGEGAAVVVADRGPGLASERLAELNARLAGTTPEEPGDGPHAGLAVVARLAARHGLSVTLQLPPKGHGLRALVHLPAAVVVLVPAATGPLATRRPTPRTPWRPALPGGEPVDVPHPRSTLVPVVPGPVPAPDGPTVEAEPEAVRELLTGQQHATAEHPVTASTTTEGRPSA
ncbi:sensor histidine kinase [Dactylosporangium darangshiense]|uniref:histidine kinase n=1 Tax=Dactylosporangium darangshiense TaxID=579108 RepID=A0ABP8D143_9ACTN